MNYVVQFVKSTVYYTYNHEQLFYKIYKFDRTIFKYNDDC